MDYINVANKIKTLRLTKGWSIAKLAEKTDLEPRTISRIELCEGSDIKVSTVLRIAKALNVTPNDLLLDELVKQEFVDDDILFLMLKPLTSEQRINVQEYIKFITRNNK